MMMEHQMLDDLPEEVVIEVFTRLPAKTLLHRTCVCKSWHSLITNPSCIASHPNRLQTLPHNNANGHAHGVFLVRN